jgi:superfamily I DNA/RNA helicase
MGARVVMSDVFARSYSELDGQVKHRVLDFVVKLQERPDTPGLNIKTPEGVADRRIKTARVSDFWRAVLIELPDSRGHVLVAVKPHDKAYEFAERVQVGVNEVTGALEVIDHAALRSAVEQAAPDGAEATATPVLEGVRARDLARFGVAEHIAEKLVTITDEEQVLALAGALPAVQGDAVLDLAAGRSAEDVWADLVAEEARDVDTADVETALDRPVSRLTFTDGHDADELRAVLEGDFQAWRVWLHPLQRRLAYHDGWRGPFRVTGGAGTGKTVTAIHRARHLAGRLAGAEPEAKVLLTTFTRNLARTIRTQLTELAGQEILTRVDVVHIDALVQRLLGAGSTEAPRPSLRGDGDDVIKNLWETARAAATGDWDIEFLHGEWVEVVLAQGIEDRAGYLHASRSGRGKRLSRPHRGELWGVFERFTQLLSAQNLMTFTQAAAAAASTAARLADGPDSQEPGGSRLPRYPHAVIDEAQDLHPAHWRLLRALVPAGKDDLFIAGDAHQRIYGRPVVLSRLGIETRGRSRRLTVNYRTSREILRWSLRVARGEAVDDLEGEPDTLDGARSEFSGPEPETQPCESPAREKASLAERLRAWHADGIPYSQIAVVARAHTYVAELGEALAADDVPAAIVAGRTEESTLGEAVRVMTMHRAKGLEFRAIAIVGAGSAEIPPPGLRRLPDEEREPAWRRERSLLYVSGSRARERLYLSWVGKPSELLSLNASSPTTS